VLKFPAMRLFALFGLFFSMAGFSAGETKVFIVVIDGVRNFEMEGRALDDKGHPVSTSQIFPEILGLQKQGTYFPEMKISNSSGVSLPAYADIFVGRRQDKITGNNPPASDFVSHFPTVFQSAKAQLKLAPESVAVFSSWGPICPITATKDAGPAGEFYKSCGWNKEKHLRPSPYADSRSDADTYLEMMREVARMKPRLTFIHLGDADEEAHAHAEIFKKTKTYYGIHHYHQALKASDYYVGRLWKYLQEDPFYKGSTYLFVTTDHGRDDVKGVNEWWDHGKCGLCSGYEKVFGVAVGPGIPRQVVKTPYTHADIAPTVASWMGFEMNEATGKPMKEITASSAGIAKSIPAAERATSSAK
jgi:hypothetical protein